MQVTKIINISEPTPDKITRVLLKINGVSLETPLVLKPGERLVIRAGNEGAWVYTIRDALEIV